MRRTVLVMVLTHDAASAASWEVIIMLNCGREREILQCLSLQALWHQQQRRMYAAGADTKIRVSAPVYDSSDYTVQPQGLRRDYARGLSGIKPKHAQVSSSLVKTMMTCHESVGHRTDQV